MRDPDETDNEGAGHFLEIDSERRLVWTSAVGPGYRPQRADGFALTVILTFVEVDGSAKYTTRPLHADPGDAQKHAEMGFGLAWGAALDWLVALAGEID